ncbi:hypothetical protein BH23GEM9_BH23GEM9_25960 [soil metagenome]
MQSTKLARVACLLLIAALLPTAQLAAQDLNAQQRQRLYYEVKPAVVLVWASAAGDINVTVPPATPGFGAVSDGEPIVLQMSATMATFGSGFIVSPDGYIATNGHVIQLFHEPNELQLKAELFVTALESSGFYEREAVVRNVGGGMPLTQQRKIELATRLFPFASFAIQRDLQVYLQNWRNFPAEVKEYSPPIFPFTGRIAVPGATISSGKDVAILKIEGRDFPTVNIGDSNLMAIGGNVTAAGYPGHATFSDHLSPRDPIQASFTRGQIASLKVDVRGTSLIQIDAAVSGGNSGGPILSDRGEVIGMLTMGVGEAFNFAVPAGTVLEFVRSAGVTPQASLFDRIWREGLNHYFRAESETGLRAGDQRAAYRASINSVDEVLRLMPDLPDAVALRQDALRKIESIPADDTGSGNMPQVVGLILLVGLGLVGTGVWMKKRNGVASDGVPMSVAKGGSKAGAQGGRLVVTAGPLQGNQFPVTLRGLKIGRDPESCEIVLTEPTVSREHAVLYLSTNDQGFVIKNLSGTNTTLVNDRAVQEATLRAGDRIKIGTSILNYEPN